MSEVKPVAVQLRTSLKELGTSFNELWTSSGILGPVWVTRPSGFSFLWKMDGIHWIAVL